MNRAEIETLAGPDDLSNHAFSYGTLDDAAIALLGFQRTKQVSKKSRQAWMQGNTEPMLAEAHSRGAEIFVGALLEIYQEYIPLKQKLDEIGFRPSAVIDVGCGQALPNLFVHSDFGPEFTLIDIERTDKQYHFFEDEGSGYASLESAREMLVDNGLNAEKIRIINPRKSPEDMYRISGDMLTSYYSCGFHYPIDEYADLMVQTLDDGGVVVFDVRKKYYHRNPDNLSRVLAAGAVDEVYEDERSIRLMLHREQRD